MKGCRALITGATGHLGATIADTLGELGAGLILVDRPGSDFETLERNLINNNVTSYVMLPCDLEDQKERSLLVDKIKKDGNGLSCLVNNAAFVGNASLTGWSVPFEHQSIDTWRRAFEINLTTAFHLSQSFAPELRNSNQGNIINVTSIYAEYGPDWSLYEDTPMGNPAAYSASKGGLLQLTRWLATTLAPKIRVNAISPGGIFRNQAQTFIDRYQARTPMKRMATEDDLRGAIVFFATKMSGYVTGETLHVDGGWTVW